MDKIIAAVAVIGAIAFIIVLSKMDLNGFVTAALIAIAIVVAIVSMARIKPKESKQHGVTGK